MPLGLDFFNGEIFKLLNEANEVKFREPQKSLDKAHKAYVISLKNGDKKGEAYSLYLMGVSNELLSNYPEAMKHLSDSIKIAASIGDKKKMADGLNTIGIINDNLGNYANALKTYFKSLKIYDEIDEIRNKAIVQSNIGLVYTNINDYVNALKFYEAANETAVDLDDRESLLVTYINLGLTYRLLQEYDKAEAQLLKALEIARNSNDHLRESLALVELGDVEISLGNREKGFLYYTQSLELKKQLNDKKGISSIQAVIGHLYLQEGNLEGARKNFTMSLEIAEALGLKKLSYEIHKFLADIFETQGDYELALFHQKTAHKRELDYLGEESDLKAKNLAIQHEVDKAQKESEIQKLRNVELAKALEDVKKLNDSLQDLNEEKNEFMAIAVHDLKNPLQNILSTARVLKKTQDPQKEMLDEFTSNIIFQTDRMFNLIKKLLDHNAIEQGNIKIRKTVFRSDTICKEVISNLEESASRKNIRIHFEDNSNGASLNTDYDILYQILDNLVSNAIKFTPHFKNVYLKLYPTLTGLVFQVIDEGPGFSETDKDKVFSKFARLSAKPTGEEHSTGLGLSIVRRLTELLEANVHYENNDTLGARFTLTIPFD